MNGDNYQTDGCNQLLLPYKRRLLELPSVVCATIGSLSLTYIPTVLRKFGVRPAHKTYNYMVSGRKTGFMA